MSTVIHERVEACRQGTFKQQICRMPSGWVVLGDVQFIEGYSLLYPDPVVPHLNAMEESVRAQFLLDMSRIGDALMALTDAVRINYEMLGNIAPALHAHVFPRYESEPEHLRTAPVWSYDWTTAPAFDQQRDNGIMQRIARHLVTAGHASMT